MVIEGDYGSALYYPQNEMAEKVIRCQTVLQSQKGGDTPYRRRLYPVISEAGFVNCTVSPRIVHAYGSREALAQGFTQQTFTAMIHGVRDEALSSGLVSVEDFDQGIEALLRTSDSDGGFLLYVFQGNRTSALTGERGSE